MFPWLLKIGSWELPTYGVLVALAFITALWLASKFGQERGLDKDKLVNLGVYCALMGMLGAKLMMIALDPEYRAHPREIFSLDVLKSAGIFYGGFILAVIFAGFYIVRQNLPLYKTCDIFAPGLALGHGIGRLGCFAAGCCWGKPTRLPWAVTFTRTDATTGVPLNIPLHPTQLYEAFSEFLICGILIWMLKRPHRDGQVIGAWALLYGIVRFLVEFVRDHDASNPFGGPLVLEQWIALALALAGVYLLFRPAQEYDMTSAGASPRQEA
ncbi:MAG TPA: prolipoprotein diacylglyceryl transferase [Bryobacteraceae bacterium]|nr:prolipoprotein diacylglyceryl transferase [Bryobacteraceae bacterium]